MAKRDKDPNTKYIFVGPGDCIPGLPHEVTIAEAEALGMLDILTAAVLNGTYLEQRAQPAAYETMKEARDG